MLNPEQESQITQVANLTRYLMENRLKGNLNLNFPGNGMVGGTGKMEIFFQIGDGMLIPLSDMETLRGAHKNVTNRTAASALEGLGQERRH